MIYLLAFILLHPLLLALFWLWARTGSKFVALPALVIDVFLNYTTASVIWGWPRRGEWTISKRLKRQRLGMGRRGRWAWRISNILNDIKPGHI